MNHFITLLQGGDKRSIGKANEAVLQVLKKPARIADLFQCFTLEDEIISMRAADALEKISVQHPQWLAPYKSDILNQLVKYSQQEIRWHVAQMLPRLPLNMHEKKQAVRQLLDFLKNDQSNIVKTCSIEALAELARHDQKLKGRLIPLFNELMQSGSPSVKSRTRKVLRWLSD